MKKTGLLIALTFSTAFVVAGEGHWKGLANGENPHGKSGCEFSKEKMAKIHGKQWDHDKKPAETKVETEKSEKEPTLDQFI